MILKSLSRKTPSFGQLAGYMSESGYMNSQKADRDFDIYRNCFAQNSADIAEEFAENSRHLSRRKNGNYLYHEILSITIEEGVDRRRAKEALRELALKYAEGRAPNNLTYGALHDDHSEHIHYHLMISANERGSSNRYWISSQKLDSLKRDLEAQCLANYPELKQQLVMGASGKEKQLSRKAAEMKRQSKKLERHDYVRRTIFDTMTQTQSLEDFHERLQEQGFTYYKRGKHHGVEVLHPDGCVAKYRFATLGVDKEYEAYQETLAGLARAQEEEREPEIDKEAEPEVQKDVEPEIIDEPEQTAEPEPQPEMDTSADIPDAAHSAQESLREAARQAAHEVEQAGKVLRSGIAGDEELGKTLEEQDREDAQEHKQEYERQQQQQKWREEIAKTRDAQKEQNQEQSRDPSPER